MPLLNSPAAPWRQTRRRALLAGAVLLLATLLPGCKESATTSPATPDTPPATVSTGYPVSASLQDSSGQQTGWRAFQYGSNGRLARVVTYVDPGPDLQWETTDDIVGEWSACSFAGSGNTVRDLGIEYDNVPLEAAARAAWDTLAPRPLQCRLGIRFGDTVFEDVSEDIFVGAGPDQVWFTSDDTPDVYRYTASQGITPTNAFSWIPTGAAGSARYRAFWYTPGSAAPMNVRESSNSGEEFNAWFVWGTGLHWNEYTLQGEGSDHVLGTADDPVYLRVVTLWGIDGSTLLRHFDDSGNQDCYVREQRASPLLNSQLQGVTTATGAGPDGVWETADDVRTEIRYRY